MMAKQYPSLSNTDSSCTLHQTDNNHLEINRYLKNAGSVCSGTTNQNAESICSGSSNQNAGSICSGSTNQNVVIKTSLTGNQANDGTYYNVNTSSDDSDVETSKNKMDFPDSDNNQVKPVLVSKVGRTSISEMDSVFDEDNEEQITNSCGAKHKRHKNYPESVLSTNTDTSSDESNQMLVKEIKIEVYNDQDEWEGVNTCSTASDVALTVIGTNQKDEEGNFSDETANMSKLRQCKRKKSLKDIKKSIQTQGKNVKQIEYKCQHCDKKLNSKRALNNHENLHEGKYRCSKCYKTFNSNNSLEAHYKVHEGFIGSEVCQVCDKTFYDKSSLTKHTRSVHMGITNHQCPYCDRSFYAKKTYDEHVRVHTGEKPFKCTLCPKMYKRVADLNHHLKLHIGQVSHTCEVCGEGFRRISELKRHTQKHQKQPDDVVLPVKEKKCQSCGLRFSTFKALNEHINGHLMGNLEPSMVESCSDNGFTAEKEKLVNEIVQELGNSGLAGNVRKETTENQNLQGQQACLDIDKDSLFDLSECLNNSKSESYFLISGASHQSRGRNTNSTLEKDEEIVSKYKKTDTNQAVKCLSDKIETTCTQSKVPIQDDDFHFQKTDEQHQLVARQNENYLEKNKSIGEIVIKTEPESDNDLENKNNDETVLNTKPAYTDDSNANEDFDSDTDSYEPFCDETERIKTNKKQVKKVTDRKRKGNNNDNDSTKKNESTKRSKLKLKFTRKNKNVKHTVDESSKDDNQSEDTDKDSEQNDFKVAVKRSKTFICEVCGKTVSSKACYKKHMDLHAGTYTCGICSKSFSSQASLSTHLDNHEGKRPKESVCKVCDKAFYDSSSLNKHVKNVHMNFRPFPCTSCDRRFSEKKTLVEHIRTHTGERPFPCQLCDKTFKRVGELNFHLKKHTGETKLTCSECGKGFIRNRELQHHIMMKHTADKPFPCSFCSKSFGSKFSLKEHITTHVPQKRFECEKCGKGFNRKAKLDKHHQMKGDCTKFSKIINGMQICKYCFLEISDFSTLEKHVKEVHEGENGEKMFYCKVCFKEFGKSLALKRHLKIHYNVRDFLCKVCGASFIQQHHLKQHMRTHTGEKPYQCTICQRSFAQSSTLYSHMKHH